MIASKIKVFFFFITHGTYKFTEFCDSFCSVEIKFAVMKVEDEIYKLTIICQLHKISLLEVSRAIEGHSIDIVCSSCSTATASCSTTAFCVFIVKVIRSWSPGLLNVSA